MIHYHGTPIGGDNINATKFLKGKHALVSFAHQSQMNIVADVCQSFILDNGAFSIWKQGGQMDYDGYVAFVDHWHKHPCYDWALIPDVIDGTEQENDEYLKAWPKSLKGVPVYHIAESIDRAVRLANSYEWMAIGSNGQYKEVGNDKWWRRIENVMNAITDSNGRPPCKLHGLKMLDVGIFTKLPLSSADSTNAARNNNLINRHGMYASKASLWIRTLSIADSVEQFNSSPVWIPNQQLSLSI